MSKCTRILIFLFTAIGSFPAARTAEAWPTYFEFGATTASVSDGAPLFLSLGKQSTPTSSSSFGVPLTLGIHLQERQRGLLFSLALQGRYVLGSTGLDESFTSFTTSPMLRVEFWRLVLGVGYTTFAWNDITLAKNSAIESVLTYEAQFLFPITPEIDFGLQASRATFTVTGYTEAPTVMEYGAFFRLNFGMSDAMSSDRRKFKGWRYPLGTPLN